MPFLLGKNSWDFINVAFRRATMLNPKCQVNDFLFIFFCSEEVDFSKKECPLRIIFFVFFRNALSYFCTGLQDQ